MDISFAILTWNSRHYVAGCLGSIRSAMSPTGLRYEVQILDNGSRDGTAELLAQFAADDPTHLFPHYERTNLGTTRSRNMLFAAARGEYLCVMDSDVELASGVVEVLLETLRTDPGLGIVVPRIHCTSGRWQKSFDNFPTVIDKAHRFLRLRQIERRQAVDLEHATVPFEIDYAISAFWLMRKSLLDTVGPLDERIFYAPEDVDFCLRVWKTGLRILYVPSVCIVHHTQEISRGLKINSAKLSHMKGLAYYFFKHRYWLRRPHLRPGS
jgi:GT2 family glycosyltransferase